MSPPDPSNHPAFQLSLLDQPFFIKQLKPQENIPPEFLVLFTSNTSGRFISLTHTNEEISIVGEWIGDNGIAEAEASWRCIKIAGPMDFGITGVMCNFTTPLKAAAVPIFAISTWNTDYILVPKEKISEAVSALTKDGWTFST